MARYVLISFDSNTEAEAFVEDALKNGNGMLQAGITVWGMYFKPTQFCECNAPGPRQSRGQKYGLWIDACGKPIRGHTQHPKNLLIPEEVLSRLEPLNRISHSIGAREGIDFSHIPIRRSVPDS